MFFKWLKDREERKAERIAASVARKVSYLPHPDRFLPPVVLRDKMYLVTEGGSIYAMQLDHMSEMEIIVQIQRR